MMPHSGPGGVSCSSRGWSRRQVAGEHTVSVASCGLSATGIGDRGDSVIREFQCQGGVGRVVTAETDERCMNRRDPWTVAHARN
jgi:hypothetical protein